MTSTEKPEMPPIAAAEAPMSEKRGRPEGDATPFITPAISTRHPSRIPQASATIPRKGILKRTPRAKSTDAFHDRREPPTSPHIRATVSYTLANDFFQLPTATVAPTGLAAPDRRLLREERRFN
ncbi:hypothetical protein M3Y99_00041200 [Aphelenchoides fujianensis]|nr:hypothetical protein M3Y99_00041200 [Aphelenchoides fujianensis]